jgi:tetratricopeptide (TPR) repeat protein
VLRGEEDETALEETSLELAAAQIKARVDPRSARSLHAGGIAHLVTREYSEAIQMLEDAARKKSGEASVDGAIAKLTDVDLLTDLAAAYLGRFRQTGKPPDASAAVKAATRAWTLDRTPTTAWNRALALQQLDRRADSAEAWRTYLQMDPSSEWATEAQGNLDRVTSPDY